jgi:aminoglycoside phosphotransferase (APT) family kinase protein
VEAIRLSELTRIGEGREAEVYALDASTALRLARTAAQAPAIDREHAALVAAGGAGAPVPAVHDRVDVDGRPGLVLERLGSRNLLLELGERPWRVLGVSRTLGTLHAAVHSVVAPPEIPPVAEKLRERLASPLVPDALRERAIARLEDLPGGDSLCHGDFHPANVLVHPEGGSVVIDWTAATRGDPAADVARSHLIIRFGALTPDATPAVRAIARIGRRLLWNGYLRSYSRARPTTDRGAVRRWLPVLATARLAEDIEEERPKLLELARDEPA